MILTISLKAQEIMCKHNIAAVTLFWWKTIIISDFCAENLCVTILNKVALFFSILLELTDRNVACHHHIL